MDQFGARKILAGGLLQSGSIIKQLWQKPLKSVNSDLVSVNSILLLGLGGGTVVKQLRKKYPDSHITAIEIDPVMIKFAHKYFDIKISKNLNIIEADAFTWIQKKYNRKIPFAKEDRLKAKGFKKVININYDLILVDIFAGNKIPPKLQSQDFLRQIKKILSPNGVAIFNCLFFDDYKKTTEKFIKKTEKEFSHIKLVHSLSNLFILTKPNI